jgi:hypothetical protein
MLSCVELLTMMTREIVVLYRLYFLDFHVNHIITAFLCINNEFDLILIRFLNIVANK